MLNVDETQRLRDLIVEHRRLTVQQEETSRKLLVAQLSEMAGIRNLSIEQLCRQMDVDFNLFGLGNGSPS